MGNTLIDGIDEPVPPTLSEPPVGDRLTLDDVPEVRRGPSPTLPDGLPGVRRGASPTLIDVVPAATPVSVQTTPQPTPAQATPATSANLRTHDCWVMPSILARNTMARRTSTRMVRTSTGV